MVKTHNSMLSPPYLIKCPADDVMAAVGSSARRLASLLLSCFLSFKRSIELFGSGPCVQTHTRFRELERRRAQPAAAAFSIYSTGRIHNVSIPSGALCPATASMHRHQPGAPASTPSEEEDGDTRPASSAPRGRTSADVCKSIWPESCDHPWCNQCRCCGV